MFSVSPVWIGRILIVIVIGGALTWLHHKVYKEGWNDRDVIAVSTAKKIKAENDAADAVAQEELSQANAKISGLQLTMANTISTINFEHKREIDDANHTIKNLRNDVSSGKLRLSVAISDSTCNQASGVQGAGTSAGSGQATAELMPEVADDLISIAADGDAAMRRANACIDAYNAVKNAINTQ
jgi:hypothetical protein